MKTDWDPNHTFEVLINQIEEGVYYAAEGVTPYTHEHILNIAYNVVFKTGLFEDECKKFKQLPVAQKTWTKLKTDFTESHQELREDHQTIRTAGYGTANGVDTVDSQTDVALENLAAATTSDRNTIATLTETNAKIVKDITDLIKKLVDLMPKHLKGRRKT